MIPSPSLSYKQVGGYSIFLLYSPTVLSPHLPSDPAIREV